MVRDLHVSVWPPCRCDVAVIFSLQLSIYQHILQYVVCLTTSVTVRDMFEAVKVTTCVTGIAGILIAGVRRSMCL
jgi:hypothetical protein